MKATIEAHSELIEAKHTPRDQTSMSQGEIAIALAQLQVDAREAERHEAECAMAEAEAEHGTLNLQGEVAALVVKAQALPLSRAVGVPTSPTSPTVEQSSSPREEADVQTETEAREDTEDEFDRHNRDEALRRRLWASVAQTFSDLHLTGDEKQKATGLAAGAAVIAAGGSMEEASSAAVEASMMVHRQQRPEKQEEINYGNTINTAGALEAMQREEQSRIIQCQKEELHRLRQENAKLEAAILSPPSRERALDASPDSQSSGGGEAHWVPSGASNRQMAREAMARRKLFQASLSQRDRSRNKKASRVMGIQAASPENCGPAPLYTPTSKGMSDNRVGSIPRSGTRAVHWSDDDPTASVLLHGIDDVEEHEFLREEEACKALFDGYESFSRIDTNGDGVISREEWRKAYLPEVPKCDYKSPTQHGSPATQSERFTTPQQIDHTDIDIETEDYGEQNLTSSEQQEQEFHSPDYAAFSMEQMI